MKERRHAVRAILIASLAVTTSVLFLGACSTTPTDEGTGGAKPPTDVNTPRIPTVTPPSTPPGTVIGPTTPGGPATGTRTAARTIYFDYDKFDIKDEYRPVVESHAKYLRENPGAKMLIQGNADERGSREYNVGLGQRRSDSVRRMLMLLGAREAQIEAVSLGEEKPACSEHTEECWAKNRRGDILYNTDK
jgi:peptidoglycan-associated lipoprotein